MTAEPLDIELPLWLQVQRKAKREAWEALPPDDQQRGRAAQAEWRKPKALETAARRKANSARMRLIVARYYCGVSAEAIGAEIGLSAEGVRKFAAKHGFVITAGPHVFRSFSFCALQERALQRLAADYGSSTNRVIEDLLKLALEADGCVARRLLHVPRLATNAA
jgi:hypothetical protein